MRQSEKSEIQQQLKKFLQLLQKGQSVSRRSSTDMGKLTTILSASERSSSSPSDKENSNSVNRSYNSQEIFDKDQVIIKQLEITNLNSQQSKLVQRIKEIIEWFKKKLLFQEARIKDIENKYQKEKEVNDELMKALVYMDEAQKQLWSAYNALNENLIKQKQHLATVEAQNIKLNQKIQNLTKNNDFMKKLVMIANQNYQLLQKKCQKIAEQVRYEQKSSRSIVSKSSKTKKHSYSPSGSEIQNISPRKEQYDGIYRKMVLRTLKSKCKRNPT